MTINISMADIVLQAIDDISIEGIAEDEPESYIRGFNDCKKCLKTALLAIKENHREEEEEEDIWDE